MKSSVTLNQFLTRRYASILGLLVVLFIFLISFMNLTGMDDTTEYYMLYEAQVLSEYYQIPDDILEFDSGKKEYYWGVEQLPKKYQDKLNTQEQKANTAYLFEHNNQYIYTLFYQNPERSALFIVVHIFEQNNQSYHSQILRIELTLLLLLILLIVIGFIIFTNKKVTSQVGRLHLWVMALTNENTNSYKLPDDLDFEELKNTAETLVLSYQKQQELNMKEQAILSREQAFLSTLSHEMRTPIAIISAASDLLNKRNTLSDKDKDTFKKVTKANNNMKQLTETLLQLWRKQPILNEIEKISLTELVNSIIEQLELDSSIIKVENKNDKPIEAQRILVSIVVTNLLRNAYQYIGNGQIEITIDKDALVISNYFDKNITTSDEKFGFGIGLYLVEKICVQNNWGIHTHIEDSIFSVETLFRSQAIS
ncbi:sensor histidine kinase [Pseudoalteromonas denitrificans]|uniref:histidine kinase n=1 Tax=Pseudoalteromonas denitrificans DSM 6059 TaxID=1123010 RepID=A0A1I1TJ18_9GAMM|nr:HAMP domain-containing sensor histidine kinase [Pseudoalteromonas denitrificans]SFD58559.1 Signal transduction histidine kinase [Pseudoalteromonas denitrificans DSM 6059]